MTTDVKLGHTLCFAAYLMSAIHLVVLNSGEAMWLSLANKI